MNSLRRKIAGFIVASLIVALGIYSVLLYANFRKIIVANQEEHLSRLAMASSREMAQWLEAKKTEMRIIADSVSLAGNNKSIIGRRLKHHAVTNPQYEMLFYADKQGNSFSSSDVQANIQDRLYFQQVLFTAAPVVSDPVVSRQSQHPIVAIAAPVKNGNRVIGVVGCTIPLVYLSQLTSHIKPVATGYAFVVQGDGTTIIHPDTRLAMKHNILKDPQIDPALLSAVSNMVRRQSGIAKYTYGKVDKYLAYAPIPGSGWALAINAPVGEVLHQLSPINRLIVITPLFVIVFASALISFLMIVLILRPLSALRNVMARVEAGDLDVRSDFVARDEIGQLTDSFNRMVQALRQGTEKLRESEEKFRHLFERAEEGILVARGEKLAFVNPALERILGHPMAVLTSKPFTAFIHPDDQEMVADRHRRRMQGETLTTRYDFRVVAFDGTVKWVTINSQAIEWEGAPANLSFVTDSTERKQAEAEIRRSENMYRSVIENIQDVFYRSDKQGNLLMGSPSGAQLFGYDCVEEMIGLSLDSFWVKPNDRERLIADILKNGRVKEFEGLLKKKNGTVFNASFTTHFYRDDDGNILGTEGIIRDITELKQAEERRRQLEDRLQRSEKMEALGMLAGGVAHDLNNVLGIVIGYSELLTNSMDNSSSLQSKIANIMQAGERAAAIVQDLLTLARRGIQTRSPVNINGIVNNFLKSPEYERILTFNPRMQVNADLQSDILCIMGSEIHVHKTIMNLVSNASEAMPNGGCLNIKTSNQYLDRAISGYDDVREGDYVVLSISDTGEGISSNDIRHIFEPFYTKKVMGRSGTGLGLAVVWGTVKDHEGYIDVQSEEGKGTTFNLYFPVTREKLSDDKISLSLSEYMGKGESVLVVDDVKGQRELASEMLSRLNYRVTNVSSGEAAVEYLKTNRVDILVLDMIMDPGMDGLDTYKEIIKLYPGQKAVIASGFSETDRVTEAHRLGVGAYVKKPYVMERLGLAVRRELDKK